MRRGREEFILQMAGFLGQPPGFFRLVQRRGPFIERHGDLLFNGCQCFLQRMFRTAPALQFSAQLNCAKKNRDERESEPERFDAEPRH